MEKSLQALNKDMYRPLEIITKGKTKEIWATNVPGIVILRATDDITAGDGAKHDTFERKARYANQTTCNVFELLKRLGVPLAYVGRYDETSFVAEQCDMIPLEVVVRRKAYGSYLKRNPEIAKGTIFEPPVVEFYLKTTGRRWKGQEIPVDDPWIVFKNGAMELYRPDQPIEEQESFMVLDGYPLKEYPEAYDKMARIAVNVLKILELAWRLLGFGLIDFKVELGTNQEGKIVLADVIDNDSWRVLTRDGEHMDKQLYREGGNLASVAEKYRKVAELTDKFPTIVV